MRTLKINNDIFSGVKTVLALGVKVPNAARLFKLSEESIRKINKSEDYAAMRKADDVLYKKRDIPLSAKAEIEALKERVTALEALLAEPKPA